MNNTLPHVRQPAKPQGSHLHSKAESAFTMFEVLLVIVALGLLAALVIPTVDRFFDATGDTAKAHNAKIMNQYMETLFNAGVDTTAWTDASGAIRALSAGVTIPPTVPNGRSQMVVLKQIVNPLAYDFTAGDTTKPPLFSAKLGDRTQRP